MKRHSCDLIPRCCVSFKSSLCQFAISGSPKEQTTLDVDFLSLSFSSNWSSWVENPGIWNSQVHCVSASVCPRETCDLHVNMRDMRGRFGETSGWSLSSPGRVAQEVFDLAPRLCPAAAEMQTASLPPSEGTGLTSAARSTDSRLQSPPQQGPGRFAATEIARMC